MFEIGDTTLHDVDTDRPRITYTDSAGSPQVLECDVVAGCDGFHGPAARMLPADLQQTWARDYPFAWLGILADVAPVHRRAHLRLAPRRLRPAQHALAQREPALPAGRPGREHRELVRRPDLVRAAHRLAFDGWQLQTGPDHRPVDHRRCAAFVSAPMRHGRLFLAGDAAHIVPPTGAKGLNLAVADVTVLARR